MTESAVIESQKKVKRVYVRMSVYLYLSVKIGETLYGFLQGILC